MDTVTLVEPQIDNGQRLLDRLAEEGMGVRAACWVKPYDRDRWTLYIATPSVDEKGTLEAYGRLIPVLRSLGDSWLTSSDVTLLSEKHPIVPYALDLLRHFPHRAPIQPPRPFLGGISIEEVFVYPLGKSQFTIYGLIFRGEPGGGLHLSFVPHDPHGTLVVECSGVRKEYPAETGRDWVVAAPEGSVLEQDEIGRTVLAWDLHGRLMRSSANEVWSLAKLGLHGFRFLREPS